MSGFGVVRAGTVTAVAAVVALGLAGCSQSVEEASGEYCADLDALRGELSSLTSLVGGDATVEQLQEQRDAVSEAYDAVVSRGDDLDQAVSTEADQAYQAYQDAVDAIPGDASLTEAAPQYAAAVQAYLADLESIADQAGCATE
jgi:hypothetical protein